MWIGCPGRTFFTYETFKFFVGVFEVYSVHFCVFIGFDIGGDARLLCVVAQSSVADVRATRDALASSRMRWRRSTP